MIRTFSFACSSARLHSSLNFIFVQILSMHHIKKWSVTVTVGEAITLVI